MRKSRKERPTEKELREVADPEVAAGKKVSTDKVGVPRSSVGPSPRRARADRTVAQPKAVGRNKKARTTARKSGMNAARKPRRHQPSL
jgi:hypothetical protein